MNIDESLRLIIRDKVNRALFEGVIPTVDCILDTGCQWYGDDEESAEQIADCMREHVDYSDYTADEFEYVLRWITYLCGLKCAYLLGVLKEDENGHIHIPKDWTKKAGLDNV